METVYIAGAIAGHDPEKVRLKFKEAQLLLMAKGYRVINPFQACENYNDQQVLAKNKLSAHDQYMDYCIDVLLPKATILGLLPCWESSAGARQEYEISKNVPQLKVHKIEELIK